VSDSDNDRESEALRGSVDGRDVAVRLAEPSLALLTVRVFIRCGGPCYTQKHLLYHAGTDHTTLYKINLTQSTVVVLFYTDL